MAFAAAGTGNSRDAGRTFDSSGSRIAAGTSFGADITRGGSTVAGAGSVGRGTSSCRIGAVTGANDISGRGIAPGVAPV